MEPFDLLHDIHMAEALDPLEFEELRARMAAAS